MSTTGLWIVTGIEGLLILGIGVFGWMASQGLTRIVVKTGTELGEKIEKVSTKLPEMIEEVIEKGGADMAVAATSAATNQVSNLENQATSAATSQLNEAAAGGVEMMSKLPKIPEVPAEAPAEAPAEQAEQAEQAGGRKQTKGNKPKKIRKPRTKKNITKVGNKMYMNFSL